jgi:exonuclease SbcD
MTVRSPVLGAHIHLHGSQVGPSLFRITPEEDVVVEGAELADQFAYVALGHIHKPQWVGREHVRYSGSIERMDLGEQGDEKGVVLVEIGPDGREVEPRLLPLPATRIYEVAVTNPAEDVPRLRLDAANTQHDLVNLHIRYTPGVDRLEEVLADLERIFPRWYVRDWQEAGALGPALAGTEVTASKGFAETVKEYLEKELVLHDEAEREAILNIADELLKEMQ